MMPLNWEARVPRQVVPYCSGFYWYVSVVDPGGVSRGVHTLLLDLTLVWDWKFYINRIVYHFLLADICWWKAHCILPLNLIPGILKNVIVFGYPSMICLPLLAKQYFPRQRQVGIHRLRNTWSWSLLSQLVNNYGDNSADNLFLWCGGCGGEAICHQNIQQSFLNQSLDPPPPTPNKNILDLPLCLRVWCMCSQTFYSLLVRGTLKNM